jgi:hypothetical protein
MSDDYLVKGRSYRDIRSIAAQTLRSFNLKKSERVDIIKCLKSGSVMTLWGQRTLIYDIVPDWNMGCDDALTVYGRPAITIRARKTVNQKALFGEGMARTTLAHELGHAVMHPGAPKARRHIGNVTPKFIPKYESAEHQADVFASEFLVPEGDLSKYQSPQDIAVFFGVSVQAAEYRFKDPLEAVYRAEGAAKLQKLADELRSKTNRSQQLVYTDRRCTNCGNATLIPIGIKYHCHTCDTVTDQFPDGD